MNEIVTLPALVERAITTLSNARTAAEVLEARDLASIAYDAAKKAARLAEAKGAHDGLIAAAHRSQADALEIEAQAKRRLADEYDAAQERGDAKKRGQPKRIIENDNNSSRASELGISSSEIYEARQIKDAEEEEPGIIRRALDEALEAGEEPTKAKIKKAIKKHSKRKKRPRYSNAPVSADPEPRHDSDIRRLEVAWEAACDSARAQMLQEIIDPEIRPELPNGARAIMGQRKEPANSLDYFPTPPWATRALYEHVLPDDCYGNMSVWEPACGEGHMAEVLKEYFREVCATDVHCYGYEDGCLDFLNYVPMDATYDWIITNPPFGDKTEQFVLRALDLARVGVAMFVRLQWLESVGRYEAIFKNHPPTVIAFFAERVPLCKGRYDPDGTTATAYIWLVWIRDRAPRAPIWIPPGQRESLTRPDDRERFTAHPVMARDPAGSASVPVFDEATLTDQNHNEYLEYLEEITNGAAGMDDDLPQDSSVNEETPAPPRPAAPALDGIPDFLRRAK